MDYGLRIESAGHVVVPGRTGYNLGQGDFTVEAMVQTRSPGPVISRKPGQEGYFNGGFLLGVGEKGQIKLATYDGAGYYTAITEPLDILDGGWHHLAGIRREGNLIICYDGKEAPVTVHTNRFTPLNIDNNAPLLLGFTEYGEDPARQFTGVIEDVGFWRRALSEDELIPTMFDLVRGDEEGLLGFWAMNNNLDDLSPVRNSGAAVGPVSFIRVCHCVWTEAENCYSYCAIDHHPTEHDLKGQTPEIATWQHDLTVAEGTPFLYGAAIDMSKTDGAFPTGAVVRVFGPDGTELNRETDSEQLYVHLHGSSVHHFVIQNPQPGGWMILVECPASVPLLLSVQTIPSKDIPETIGSALQKIYYQAPDRLAASYTWSWSDVSLWAGIALSSIATGVAIGAVAAGTAIAAPAIVAATVAVGFGSMLTQVGLLGNVVVGAKRISDGIGLGGPVFGGTRQGAVTFLHDGCSYFPRLRDLLLAVQAGSYDPAAITIPACPTFENIIRGISSAGRNAYVLMWDTSVIYHMIDTNDYLKYYLRKYIKRDARRNAQTYEKLAGLPGVDVCMEPYFIYQSPLPFHSNHQKITIVSVNNVKCALVGGLNLITPSYWDEPEHPMHPDEQGQRNFHTWHDTALLLQGPVVELIEAEFNRRWQSARPERIINEGTYAKVACWEIQYGSCLDYWTVCSKGAPSPVPYRNPITEERQYPLDFLLTNSEYEKPVTQIKTKICHQIESAQQYIYFENCAFFDLDVTTAIIQKLAVAPKNFLVIILIPHSTKKGNDTIHAGYAYLSRNAFASMLLSGTEWEEVTFTDQTTIKRDECTVWQIDLSLGPSIEYAVFKYKLKKAHGLRTIAVREVTNIVPAPDCRLLFSSPARYFEHLDPNEEYELPGWLPNFRKVYTHSKLALFDDEYALVGSCNFTSRSLNWDGECSVGINDSEVVRKIREELFRYWNIDSVQNWRDQMWQFAQHPTPRLGILPLRLNVLETESPRWYWRYLSAVLDPVDFY